MGKLARWMKPGVALENKRFLRIKRSGGSYRRNSRLEVSIERRMIEAYDSERAERDVVRLRRISYLSLTALLTGICVSVFGWSPELAFGILVGAYAFVRAYEWSSVYGFYNASPEFRDIADEEQHRFDLFCELQQSGSTQNDASAEAVFSVDTVLHALGGKHWKFCLKLLKDVDDRIVTKKAAFHFFGRFRTFWDMGHRMTYEENVQYDREVMCLLAGIGQNLPGVGTWQMLIEIFRRQIGDSSNQGAVVRELVGCAQSSLVTRETMRDSIVSLMKEGKSHINEPLVQLAVRLKQEDLLDDYIGLEAAPAAPQLSA